MVGLDKSLSITLNVIYIFQLSGKPDQEKKKSKTQLNSFLDINLQIGEK